jgi:hypothetical protein
VAERVAAPDAAAERLNAWTRPRSSDTGRQYAVGSRALRGRQVPSPQGPPGLARKHPRRPLKKVAAHSVPAGGDGNTDHIGDPLDLVGARGVETADSQRSANWAFSAAGRARPTTISPSISAAPVWRRRQRGQLALEGPPTLPRFVRADAGCRPPGGSPTTPLPTAGTDTISLPTMRSTAPCPDRRPPPARPSRVAKRRGRRWRAVGADAGHQRAPKARAPRPSPVATSMRTTSPRIDAAQTWPEASAG